MSASGLFGRRVAARRAGITTIGFIGGEKRGDSVAKGLRSGGLYGLMAPGKIYTSACVRAEKSRNPRHSA